MQPSIIIDSLNRTGLSQRLWISLVAFLCIFIALGILVNNHLNSQIDITEKMVRHPLAVNNAAREIKYLVTAMNSNMKDIVLEKSDSERELLISDINAHDRQVISEFNVIRERLLGDKTIVDKALSSFNEWRPIRQQVYKYLSRQDTDIDAGIVDNSTIHVLNIELETNDLLNASGNNAVAFVAESRKQQENIVTILWVTILVTTLMASVLGYFSIRNFVGPISRAAKALEKMAEGDVSSVIVDTNRGDEIGAIANALQDLQHSTSTLAESASMIARGIFTLDITPRSNRDLLGKSMAEMLRSLKQSRYLRDGVNGLNEVMLGNLSLEKLAEKIISYMCQYTSAQVGCFYVVNDYEIQRIAGYGYTESTLSKNTYEMGEGIIGEAALQKQPMLLHELPDNYLKLSSATGEIDIKIINVIPLLWDNKIIALMEFGLFHEFSENDDEFIASVGTSIAITVNTLLNKKTEQSTLEPA